MDGSWLHFQVRPIGLATQAVGFLAEGGPDSLLIVGPRADAFGNLLSQDVYQLVMVY
jgi:hypothetical protein